MKVIDDGIIKYDRSNFTQCGPIVLVEYSELEDWRKKLYERELIGEYKEERVGYGNLSCVNDYRTYHATTNPQFLITGTQTGRYKNLDGRFYTRVLDYDVSNLKIKVMGPIEASSEALTHAAIYSANPKISAVFHIHSKAIWEGMKKDQSLHTASDIPYGTVEMATATQECVRGKNAGAFCMHGHEDGVVSFGRSMDEAGSLILELYEKYCKQA